MTFLLPPGIKRLKNNFPMLVFTFKEKDGLNHMNFLLVSLFSSFRVCWSVSLFLYFNSSLKPLLGSASLFVVFAVSKMSWLHEISGIHLLLALGRSFEIFGGWFDCLLIQTVSLFGFRHDWYVLFIKSKLTSSKLLSLNLFYV